MTPAPSPEQRERDGRLAWIVVAACACLSLTLIVLAVLALRGPAARWAEESMRETREQAARERTREDPWQNLPTPPTAPPPSLVPAPPPGPVARPVGSVAAWIGPSDYPLGALRRNEEGRVRVTVTVGPDGEATGCSVLMTSGFDSLDNGTCSVMMRNGRWNRGTPGETRVRRWTSPAVRWVLPE